MLVATRWNITQGSSNNLLLRNILEYPKQIFISLISINCAYLFNKKNNLSIQNFYNKIYGIIG